MKNILHLFSRDVVSEFLETRADKSNKSRIFEFIAALLMQRLYEEQWAMPTMIGFYINREYSDRLKKFDNPSYDLLFEALESGIDEDYPHRFRTRNGCREERQLPRISIEAIWS
jgi:hypothetical protein